MVGFYTIGLTFLFVWTINGQIAQQCIGEIEYSDIKDCCDKPIAINDVLVNCVRTNSEPKKSLKIKEYKIWKYVDACSMDCFLNATGIIENDTFDLSAANKMLATIYPTDTEYAQKMSTIYEKCDKTVKEILPKTLQVPNIRGCSAYSELFATCILREEFLECPEMRLKYSEKCSYRRSKLIQCPQLFVIQD